MMNYIKYLESTRGTKLYTKIMDVEAPKANVIMVHGLAEHLDRYDEVAAFFHQNHFNVIRYDQRGHGRSEGTSAYLEDYNDMAEDLDTIIKYTKATYGGKVYVLGHSMGGFTAVLYGTKYPNSADGYITSGAATRLISNPFEGVDMTASADTYINNELSTGVCSEQEVMEKYEKDDLVKEQISLGLIQRLTEGVEYLKKHPASFVDAILIMHGRNDGLISVEDSIKLYNEIVSESKSLRVYDGLEHEILNESSYNQIIFLDMLNWMNNLSEK